MNIVIFILLGIFLIMLVLVYVWTHHIYGRNRAQKTQLEKRIVELESEIGSLKTELAKDQSVLKVAREKGVYDVYATPVISHINEGIICIDKNHIIQLVNVYAKQYIDDTDALGKQYQQVIHMQKIDGTPDYSMFDAAFFGKTVHISDQMELVNQHGKIPIVGTIVPLESDLSGSIVFIFSDDSERVERKKEDQAFFSAAAHELRTPLTVIRLTVSLLQSKYDTLGREKIMEYLRRMSETTESLVRLVNDFLNVSRIDQGRLQVNHEPFDIVTLTDEVIKELDLLVHERKLYIRHEPTATEIRLVVGDRNKAKEVLINLISNSIKYTVQGGVTIAHDAIESLLATRVTDTGGGIPLDSQGLLFKRFLQIGSARGLASTKSSGFGLYLSKKFALLMHGDIVLEKSEPGKGSTFVFTLPLN